VGHDASESCTRFEDGLRTGATNSAFDISGFADTLWQNLLVSQHLVAQIHFDRISGVRTSFHGENIRHIGDLPK
jgi:hypothetical protein